MHAYPAIRAALGALALAFASFGVASATEAAAPASAVDQLPQGQEVSRTVIELARKRGYEVIERQIKPWKLGAKNWLFVGSELAGQRAAVVMSLVQSAKLNGLDPWAYLRDVLARIHSHPNHRLDELLPHRWRQD